MTKTLENTQIEGVTTAETKSPYEVQAFNNEVTTFGQVVTTLTQYGGHSLASAEAVTLKIHKHGSAIVFTSVSRDKCEVLIKAFAKVGVDAKLLETS